MIYKFNTSCNGQSTILALIEHYKGNSHKNKENTIAYATLNKST